MIYQYKCQKCEEVMDVEFAMGHATKEVKCEKCGSKAVRFWSEANFILLGGGWPGRTMKFNKQQTEKNLNAGRRMRKTWGEPPKLVR